MRGIATEISKSTFVKPENTKPGRKRRRRAPKWVRKRRKLGDLAVPEEVAVSKSAEEAGLNYSWISYGVQHEKHLTLDSESMSESRLHLPY